MTEDQLRQALRRAWSMGQAYWSQVDSESYSDNRRSDVTLQKYRDFVEETVASLSQSAPMGAMVKRAHEHGMDLGDTPVAGLDMVWPAPNDTNTVSFDDALPVARAEDAQPVAWRHSHTHCLYETEDDVPLADADEWAEPLYLTPSPKPVVDAATTGSLTDEQREALNEAICWAHDDGLPGTEDHLRSILTAHPANEPKS
jgi:hypothetical protein